MIWVNKSSLGAFKIVASSLAALRSLAKHSPAIRQRNCVGDCFPEKSHWRQPNFSFSEAYVPAGLNIGSREIIKTAIACRRYTIFSDNYVAYLWHANILTDTFFYQYLVPTALLAKTTTTYTR